MQPSNCTSVALSLTSVRSMQISSGGRNDPRNNPQSVESLDPLAIRRAGTAGRMNEANWRRSAARANRARSLRRQKPPSAGAAALNAVGSCRPM